LSQAPIKLAIKVDDPLLAGRLADLLSNIPGLTLTDNPQDADVNLSVPSGPRNTYDLTAREHEVLALLVEGASNKEIGRRLGISTHTAKFHVRQITDKLDAVGRTDAVALALQLRMIEI
jgi:DNA-binding CsgD family transcriptional regulator